MQTFKVLSAFYIKDKDALLVAVEGRDARFKPGARAYATRSAARSR